MSEYTPQEPIEIGPPPPESRRKQRPAFRWLSTHYNDLVAVAIAFVTIVAALAAFLQSWASDHYAREIRLSQALATETLGQDMRSRQREGYDFFLYTTWNEWDWRRSRATSDPALAERAEQVTELIAPLTPLLDETGPYYITDTDTADLYSYHADINVYTTTLLAEQRAFVTASADVWNGKADGYVTVLTILAVTLFLFGLSTTVKGNLRFLFAIVATFLVIVGLVQIVGLTLGPVPDVPYGAIQSYARARAAWWSGRTDDARSAISETLELYPGYGNAHSLQADILLDDSNYDAATAAYRQALASGTDEVSIYWDMGWTLYLAGDYDGSLEASRHALELAPHLLPVRMNIATALLAQGKTNEAMDEYEAGLGMAVDPALAIPSSWSRLYLRETVNDLDRLINALDGQTDFYQVPRLDKIADPSAVREAAVRARQRIKEGVVAIEAAGSPRVGETSAQLGEITFGLYAGRRGDLLAQADTFPRGILSLVADIPYENLPLGAVLSRRVVRMQYSGVPEYLPTMGADVTWDGAGQGTLLQVMESPWPGQRGLLPGTYTVEYYVDGNLLQSGSFAIPEKEDPIVGPLIITLDSRSGGIAYGPDSIFPAGLAQVKGIFNYSGLDGATLYATWYRNGEFYSQDSSYRDGWGSEGYYLYDVPAGKWRLELGTDQETLQTAEFEVVPVDAYLQAIGTPPEDDALFHRMLGDVYASAGNYAEADIHYAQSVELDPACEQCYYRWWSALYDQKRYQEAVPKIEDAIALNPENYNYLSRLGKTYYQLGDEENAKSAFRRGVPIAPATVYNAWGNALYELDRYDESLIKYMQAIDLEPDNATYYSNLGGAYLKLGEEDLAQEAFDHAMALNPNYDTAYNKQGDLLYADGQYAEAAEQYLQAIAIEPGKALYHVNLAKAYNQMGEYELANSEFQTAVELDPAYDYAWNLWGNMLYDLEDYAGAAAKYEQAIAIDPNDAIYHSNLGGAYRELAEYELAADEYAAAVEIDPNYDAAWNRWGNALYSLEDYAGAADKYLQAIAVDPENAVYRANLGGAYYEQGEYDLAAAAYEAAVGLDPNYDYAWNRWGNSLYLLEDYAGAAAKYQQAIGVNPEDEVYHANLGGAYYKQGEYEMAAAAYAAAVAVDPNYDAAWNSWGNSLYLLGDYAGAADKYQQAAQVRPDKPVYYYNLGMAYYQLEEYASARPAFEQAAQLAAEQGDTSTQQDAEDMLAKLP
jgi:tetratricopeptide (TPR) repeat protein